MDINNLDRAHAIRSELEKLNGTLNTVNKATDSPEGCVMKMEVKNGITKLELNIPFEPVQNEMKVTLLKYKQYIKTRIAELKEEVEEL